jgi:hypothetical protein
LELFFIVAQTVWDFFLIFLACFIVSIPVAYTWAWLETHPYNPKQNK